MKTRRRIGVVVGALALAMSAVAAPLASATGLPSKAARAGDFLASALVRKTTHGQPSAYVPYGGEANLSLTAEGILAFHALGRLTEQNLLVTYLAARAEKYVHISSGCGSTAAYDDAGHLGMLLLVANITGTQSAFDVANLRTRLLASQRTTGSNAGLFGLNSAKACFDGTQRTSFALLGLMADGRSPSDPAVTSGVSWLVSQQCSNGAFPAFRGTEACAKSGWGPNHFDTNSTASAVLALQASGPSITSESAIAAALGWLAKAQNADGSWGFYKGDTGDSNSTSWVIMALVATHQLGQVNIGPVNIQNWTKGTTSPYGALGAFQDRSTHGIFWQPGSLPDTLSTVQGIVGLTGFNLALTLA